MDPPKQTSETADVIADVPIKRPPEDDESLDGLHRAPPKRQAVERSFSHGPGTASRASSEATDSHLFDMNPDELISTIHQMQATHARQMAELRDQYTIVSRQLEQLRSLANNHLASQVLAIQSVQHVSHPTPDQALDAPDPADNPNADTVITQSIASIAIPQPVSVPSVPAFRTIPATPPSLSTPTRSAVPISLAPGPSSTPRPNTDKIIATRQQELSESPSTSTPGTTMISSSSTPGPSVGAKVELKITPSPIPGEPPTVEQSSLDTVHEVWEEYRHGRNGNPPLESLDALWGARWRPDAKIRVWYGRRKAILDKIRQYIADGIDEQNAVLEVERMRRGRTLHWLSRILLEDRKATKKQWKAAQKAATAAKQAMHGQPPAE